jgi:hypothetical protein
MNRDDPDIGPLAFLYACMHDQSLPIADRINAACHLMQIEPDGPVQPTVTIRISGIPSGDKMQQLFDSFSPEIQRDLMFVKRCYDAGFYGPFDIDDMPVKGRA